ncbi:MAG TPA: hypothetical protein VF103_00310 [Polyangiaceae bacterium]
MSVEPAGVLVPPACACCGAEAARSDVARLGSSAQEIIVGYCDDCRKHQGALRARRLAGVLASGLVGLSFSLVLPLASRPLPPVALSGVAFVGAVLPLLVVALWPSRRTPGHAAEGPAVRFVANGELLCADDRWAAELARSNGAARRLAPWREPRLSLVMLVGPLFAPLLALVAANLASPVVRVVNLTGDQLVVEVDGVRRASLAPTSVESPSAGAELRVAVGEHDLVARSLEGRVLERAHAVVESGHAHLFAPASEGHCFWLESVRYGRSGAAPAERTPLDGPPHFWSLPTDLGGWFSAPPESAIAETRWTGGTVTVLRQAPCEAVH